MRVSARNKFRIPEAVQLRRSDRRHAAGDGAAVAWEIGWLNECQGWLHTIAGMQNKAGDMLQARIAALISENQEAA